MIVEDAEGPAKTFPTTTVEFLALDPSGVPLDHQSQELNTENVRVEGVSGVHSERTVRYYYPNALQASRIEFVDVGADEQPTFKFFCPRVDSNVRFSLACFV